MIRKAGILPLILLTGLSALTLGAQAITEQNCHIGHEELTHVPEVTVADRASSEDVSAVVGNQPTELFELDPYTMTNLEATLGCSSMLNSKGSEYSKQVSVPSGFRGVNGTLRTLVDPSRRFMFSVMTVLDRQNQQAVLLVRTINTVIPGRGIQANHVRKIIYPHQLHEYLPTPPNTFMPRSLDPSPKLLSFDGAQQVQEKAILEALAAIGKWLGKLVADAIGKMITKELQEAFASFLNNGSKNPKWISNLLQKHFYPGGFGPIYPSFIAEMERNGTPANIIHELITTVDTVKWHVPNRTLTDRLFLALERPVSRNSAAGSALAKVVEGLP
jgi:hypothetical protein